MSCLCICVCDFILFFNKKINEFIPLEITMYSLALMKGEQSQLMTKTYVCDPMTAGKGEGEGGVWVYYIV